MFNGKKISLIFPAYNEEKNIAKAISDFKRQKIIDEILVINNNSKDNTEKIARKSKAIVVNEKNQGYGFALRRGLKEAKGDLIVLCEPDNTFDARDIIKLLNKTDRYDMVTGTRTNIRFIGKNANMKGLLRLGNILLARLIQFLYNPRISLTDCGCTFRVISKSGVKKVLPKLRVGGSFFLSELIVVSLLSDLRILEVPVHYRERVGESKITGSLRKSILVGLQMFLIVMKHRFTQAAK
jgi:glycosyltransferase involved in cell wall biosynthesis